MPHHEKSRRLVVTLWDRNPEVAAFVTNLLGKVPQTEIQRRITERFGADKTPSTSTLGRFAEKWKALHKATGNSRLRASPKGDRTSQK